MSFVGNLKKFIKILTVIFLLLVPYFSTAQVYINEIMYDSPGADDDWVEIYNSGTASVTIVTGSGGGSWRFVDSSSHTLTLIAGETTLAPGTYAIITNDTGKFLADWVGFSGTLFKSSFSLTNTNNTVYLKNGDGVATDPAVSYTSTQGAKGDGNSLQRQPDGSWVSATPTPGATNTVVSSSNFTSTTTETTDSNETTNTTTSSSINTSAHSSPAPLSDTENKIEFEISAGRDRLTTVGNNLAFRATPTRLQNMSEQGISYHWSFGDGTTAQGNVVNHAYKFAGEYSVVVNANYSDKQAVSRMEVKVISPNLSLTRISDGTEIQNNSKTEINLEGWKLISARKTFVFPIDTLISAGKKTTFSDSVTSMSDETIQLLNPMDKEFGLITKMEKTDVDNSVLKIEQEIEQIKNTIAQMTKEQDTRPTPVPILVSEPISAFVEPEPILSEEQTGQVASPIIIFEAQKEMGFVGRVFAWPIKGFNFIRRLFVEE